ncbi:hypothetical protein ACM36E_001173 [Cronobacter sakazakii]|uniref:hypothetical protein n=1 Tax=Cronobacter sakazakii TaxID=28141 RepID=UPI000F5C5893|nr:hypothetical protein [Cronobacter sakazakii]EKC6205950.1 hypothetical protein [Cronobacter sakazakii]EKD3162991.1 hypothetical protein [Cronobacter sakazakii]EKD3181869.1 hypothetical protein [Cronobacter sakazakii]EKD3191155.1 hypothetical protein [Cronobacter sakazakii]EKD3199658.1 hypothetical protein [Cronobacter sakazakii]
MTAFLNAYSTHFWWGADANGPGLIPKCSITGDECPPRWFLTLALPLPSGFLISFALNHTGFAFCLPAKKTPLSCTLGIQEKQYGCAVCSPVFQTRAWQRPL